jgi:hypothetical protein
LNEPAFTNPFVISLYECHVLCLYIWPFMRDRSRMSLPVWRH